MPDGTEHSSIDPKPSLKELGFDLLKLHRWQLVITLALPFVFFGLYFVFASKDLWALAVLATMGLSFTSYGSTSHDLVHENLRINKTVNSMLLSVLELICYRSGHAYKQSHLYHHKRFPHDDDVEGAASRMTLWRTLLEGVIFQFKLYHWAAFRNCDSRYHTITVFEGVAIVMLFLTSCWSLVHTYIFCIYMLLMIAGSWIIPLITSYAVHTPHGADELRQTRLFRGRFFALIAFDHLYHLEHHLYPMVPHKNWPRLAKRLDGYFHGHGVKPIALKLFKHESERTG